MPYGLSAPGVCCASVEDTFFFLSRRKARMLSLKTADWAVGQRRERPVRSLLGNIGTMAGCRT